MTEARPAAQPAAQPVPSPVKGPRDFITAEFVDRAKRDKAFRARLLKEPRATVEQELGVTLPARVAIHVHEETPESLHFVLPLAADELNDAVIARTELGDREVAGYYDETGKGDPTVPYVPGRSVGGVRG
jgi:hypothetical protein